MATLPIIGMLTLCCATAAHASLGGDGASVEADRQHMKALHALRQTTAPSGSYTVSESTLTSGTLVREYVSDTGIVFAVVWSGPMIPDLKQLLGPHYDALIARQSKLTHAGHRSLVVHDANLVIESGGHPRSFAGRAYLPGQFPKGFSAQEIQ